MKLSFYPSSVSEDIVLCLGVTFLSACMSRDEYLPEAAAEIIRSGAMLLCILCWLAMAFLNGLRMRKRFAAGMCLCLILPPVIQLAVNNIRAIGFSEWGIAADKLCQLFSRLPYSELEKASGLSGNIISVLTAAMGLMLFGAGYLYTKKMISNFERNDTL